MASDTLRISRALPFTRVNGPGKRFSLWVQGCRGVPQLSGVTKHCEGCWNKHTWSRKAGSVVSVDDVFALVEEAVHKYGVEGITFSGGEPFQQAEGLAELARRCKEQGLNVVVFTGYTHEYLCSEHTPLGADELLRHVDLLIDGPYTARLRVEDAPLRGSSNQRLVPLTEVGKQLADRVTDDLPIVEFNFTGGGLAVTGFPR